MVFNWNFDAGWMRVLKINFLGECVDIRVDNEGGEDKNGGIQFITEEEGIYRTQMAGKSPPKQLLKKTKGPY